MYFSRWNICKHIQFILIHHDTPYDHIDTLVPTIREPDNGLTASTSFTTGSFPHVHYLVDWHTDWLSILEFLDLIAAYTLLIFFWIWSFSFFKSYSYHSLKAHERPNARGTWAESTRPNTAIGLSICFALAGTLTPLTVGVLGGIWWAFDVLRDDLNHRNKF